MEFSRQEYWSGLLFPTPGDLPDQGIKPASPALQVDSLPLSHQGSRVSYNNCSLIKGGLDHQGLATESIVRADSL